MNSVALTAPTARAALATRRASVNTQAADLAQWIVDATFPVFGLGPVVDLGFGDTTLADAFNARGISASVVNLTDPSGLSSLETAETVFLVLVLECLASEDLAPFLHDVHRIVS